MYDPHTCFYKQKSKSMEGDLSERFCSDQNMSQKEVTFFDISKTERARAFLLFSHIPHSKQDDMVKV